MNKDKINEILKKKTEERKLISEKNKQNYFTVKKGENNLKYFFLKGKNIYLIIYN